MFKNSGSGNTVKGVQQQADFLGANKKLTRKLGDMIRRRTLIFPSLTFL
jgi:hypothetical protein